MHPNLFRCTQVIVIVVPSVSNAMQIASITINTRAWQFKSGTSPLLSMFAIAVAFPSAQETAPTDSCQTTSEVDMGRRHRSQTIHLWMLFQQLCRDIFPVFVLLCALSCTGKWCSGLEIVSLVPLGNKLCSITGGPGFFPVLFSGQAQWYPKRGHGPWAEKASERDRRDPSAAGDLKWFQDDNKF